MAFGNVIKKGGHAVTGTLPPNSDAVQAKAAQPNFMPTQGFAAHNGGRSGSGFPGARGGSGGVAKSPKQQTPPTNVVPLAGNN